MLGLDCYTLTMGEVTFQAVQVISKRGHTQQWQRTLCLNNLSKRQLSDSGSFASFVKCLKSRQFGFPPTGLATIWPVPHLHFSQKMPKYIKSLESCPIRLIDWSKHKCSHKIYSQMDSPCDSAFGHLWLLFWINLWRSSKLLLTSLLPK